MARIRPDIHPLIEALAMKRIATMTAREIQEEIDRLTDEGVSSDMIFLLYEELDRRCSQQNATTAQ